jgi:hypothetical protein
LKRLKPDAFDTSLSYYPGRPLADMVTFQDATSDHSKRRHGADTERRRGLVECELAPFRPLTLSIDGDVMLIPKSTDTTLRPAIIPTGQFA